MTSSAVTATNRLAIARWCPHLYLQRLSESPTHLLAESAVASTARSRANGSTSGFSSDTFMLSTVIARVFRPLKDYSGLLRATFRVSCAHPRAARTIAQAQTRTEHAQKLRCDRQPSGVKVQLVGAHRIELYRFARLWCVCRSECCSHEIVSWPVVARE